MDWLQSEELQSALEMADYAGLDTEAIRKGVESGNETETLSAVMLLQFTLVEAIVNQMGKHITMTNSHINRLDDAIQRLSEEIGGNEDDSSSIEIVQP